MIVDVIKYQMYRDGGTTEYVDKYGRRYFVPAPIHNDKNIYSAHPCHISKNDYYRKEHLITGITLNIVDKF